MKNFKYIENLIALIVTCIFMYEGFFTNHQVGFYGTIAIMALVLICSIFWVMLLRDNVLFTYGKTMLFPTLAVISFIGIGESGIYLISGLLSLAGALINYEILKRGD